MGNGKANTTAPRSGAKGGSNNGSWTSSWSGKRRGIVQISEVANGLIDPLLAKRAGINTMLLGAWGRDRRLGIC